MKRREIQEWLDSDAGSPADVAASLADLRRINRWFGSISTICGALQRVARQTNNSQLSLLDAGAGSGDIAAAAQARLRRGGVHLSVTLLDRSATHMRQPGSQNGREQAPAVAASALSLPFADKSFDLVACSTFAHHLSPVELLSFVREGLRAARLAVIINDLRRHAMHLALVYAGFPLFRSPLTRHDGPASVRRSYTPREMEGILKQAGAGKVEISTSYLFRMAAIAWKI